MDFPTMRAVDRGLGEPLCRLARFLSWVAGLAGRRRAPVEPRAVRRVLIVKFIGIGSLAEAVPMLRAVRRHYPAAEFSFLTFEWCAGLVRLLGFTSVRVVRTDTPLHFVLDTLETVFWGWRSRFEVIHDMESLSTYSALVSFGIHAPERVGFSHDRSARGGLYTRAIRPLSGKHILFTYMSQLGMGPENLLPEDSAVLHVPEWADREAEALLQKAGLWGAPRMVAVNINVGEMSSLSMWSLTYHSVLAVRLHETHRAAIAFIGSPRERARVDDVLGALPAGVRAANLAGLTSVEILLAVLRRSNLLVSNESGPLSLAGLVGTGTLGFFGAGAARVYGPRGARSLNLDREEHPRCKACQELPGSGGKACPFGMRCVSEITPERAFESAAKMLGEPEQ